MKFDAGDVETRHAALPRAEHVAFAAQLQIFLGDAETVFGLAHDGETCFRRNTERRAVEQETARARSATADAATQLVQLRQPETLRVLDHHHARFRHIDADLDHGGGDQEPGPPGGKLLHGMILLHAAHPAVDQTDGRAKALLQILEAVLGGGEIDGFGFLD